MLFRAESSVSFPSGALTLRQKEENRKMTQMFFAEEASEGRTGVMLPQGQEVLGPPEAEKQRICSCGGSAALPAP